MTLSTHIVRRGLEYAHNGMLAASEIEQPNDGDGTKVSPIAALIFLLTGLALVLALFSVSVCYIPLTGNADLFGGWLHVRTSSACSMHGRKP
jgi:hypothetical protein